MSPVSKFIKPIFSSALSLSASLFIKIKEFNDLSPPLYSRIPTIISLHILQRYFLYGLSLFKDSNPNTINAVRDIPNIANIGLNVYNRVPFSSDIKILQTWTHCGGQAGRFICRTGLQAPAIFANSSNTASVSKASNLVCEVIAIAATDLSSKSQSEGKILYYISPPDLQYYQNLKSTGIQYQAYEGFKYIKEKTGYTYFLNNFATACFRAAILYGIGEVVVTPLKNLVITSPIHYLHNTAEKGMSYIANIPENVISFKDDPYTAYNKITTQTNHTIAGYVTVALLEIQHLVHFAAMEAIIGNLMISSSRVITPKLMAQIQQYPVPLVIAIDIGLISFVYNQENITSLIAHSVFNGIETSINFIREQLNYIAYETIEGTMLGDLIEL